MNEFADDPAGTANDWKQIRSMLDGVMDELGDGDRELVLLRYFARQPFSEIGRTLGLSDDAARMRVERAVEKLRGKQGIWQRSLAVLARLSGGGFSMLPFSVVTDTVECLGR